MSTLYEPLKISDLFYNQDQAQKLKTSVQNGQPTLIYGPQGVGKTCSVHVVAKELNMALVEINGSDDRGKAKLQGILERARVHGFVDVIYFLDEADGISDWSIVEKILLQSKHPVVLAANDAYKIPDSIKNRCNQLKYQTPSLMAVADLIKKVAAQRGFKPHYELLGKGTDFRSALLSSVYGGSRREASDNFKDVEQLFKNGIIPDNFDGNLLLWCMDNSTYMFRGSKMVEYILMLSRVDMIRKEGVVDRGEILAQFRSQHSERVQYPNFLKRSGVLKRRVKSDAN